MLETFHRFYQHPLGARELRCRRRAHVVERIPFEREEREVGQSIASLEIRKEASQPGGVVDWVCRVTARQNLLEAWTTQLQCRIDLMNRGRELKVERPEVFRRGILTVGLLTQLNLGEFVATREQVTNGARCVLRRVIQKPGRYQHWQLVRQTGTINAIQPRLLDVIGAVRVAMPRIGR